MHELLRRWPFFLLFLFTDWLSLTKSSVILDTMAARHIKLFWIVTFLAVDTMSTLLLLMITTGIFNIGLSAIHYGEFSFGFLWAAFLTQAIAITSMTSEYFGISVFSPINDDVAQVATMSTLLTSVWVTLFLISTLIIKLLAPLEYIRRFTVWWFKDIDAHPLRAVAKVAATLIVVGAFVLKAVRWGWLMG
jgi:hypothetical protein